MGAQGLAAALLPVVREFYTHEENVQAFEAWLKRSGKIILKSLQQAEISARTKSEMRGCIYLVTLKKSLDSSLSQIVLVKYVDLKSPRFSSLDFSIFNMHLNWSHDFVLSGCN